jgi:Tol biopolymer transport system component
MNPIRACAAAALALAAAVSVGPAGQPKRAAVTSHVTVLTVDGMTRKVIYSAPRRFEAPNWSPDGKYLLLNAEGKLWRLPAAGGEPEQVATGDVTGINNDHGISPDGKLFAISAGHIYVLPSSGGKPRQVTRKTPSYYHGWSPDGKTLVYCARRDGNFDIYAIPVEGGEEKRLTSHPGYDDGPDYSPDGKWIYFNSDRSGSWDIWRMPADGAGPEDRKAERVTSDDYEDWFPHPSPDGRWLLFLSYPKGTKGHPADKDVVLRMMPLPGAKVEGGAIREVVKLFGGQGTLNVSSWSPDGKRFAYVSYSRE